MKKTVLIVLSALALGACTNKNEFTIEGTIEGAQDSVLYLYNKTLGGAELMDSTVLDATGHFLFNGAAPDAPDFYLLRINDQVINIAIDSVEAVTVKATYPGMASNYQVEGSENCEMIRQLALKQQDLQRRVMALDYALDLGRGQRLDSLLRMVKTYKDDVNEHYIFKEPQKAYAYFALFQMVGSWNIYDRTDPQDIKAFGAVATCWDTYYPNALRTEHLRNTALKGMNEQRAVQAREQATLPEDIFVDAGMLELRLPEANGTIRTLSELKGQVVLLDFHAFSMEQSSARILELRELYNKYHSRGLEIYQVSMDQNEHFWKQQTSSLPWICVYDPAGSAALSYNVQALPEFFLIDRDNNLQKRSSQMTDVEEEIKKLL